MNFCSTLPKVLVSDEISNTCSDGEAFFLFPADKLNNESVAFPVNMVCLLQSLHGSQRSIKTIDLLHSFNVSHTSSELSSKIGLFRFSPSDQPALHSLRLPLPWPASIYLPSSRHAQWLQSCILKGCAVSLHETVSPLNRYSSWADTQGSPRESVFLMQRELRANGSRQWCDKLRFLIFHSADLFLSSTALPTINTPLPSHPHLSATPPSCFPSPSVLWSGRPIAVVMRKVNWPCCDFRRLDRDAGSGTIGGGCNFLHFLWMPTCILAAVHIIWNLSHWESFFIKAAGS